MFDSKQFSAQIQYAKKERLPQLMANSIIVLTVIAILLVRPEIGEKWSDSIGAISSIATFFIAIMLWFNDLARDWKDSLEKRLFVDFIFKDASGHIKTAMKCEGAYLSGESDIRQWGQQIGKQMNNNQILIFNALPEIDSSRSPMIDEKSGQFFKPYFLRIMLDSDEKGLPKLVDEIKNQIAGNKMLIWTRQNGMAEEWVIAS